MHERLASINTFSLSSHQRNTNLSCMEILFHPVRAAVGQKMMRADAGGEVDRRECFHADGGNI